QTPPDERRMRVRQRRGREGRKRVYYPYNSIYLKGWRGIQIMTRSSLILIIQLHQDLKILDDDIDMRAGSLSGTIFVNIEEEEKEEKG
ncbi:NAD(P)-binding Rossmann-fold superfamily protein, partial [Prunus dulcis]